LKGSMKGKQPQKQSRSSLRRAKTHRESKDAGNKRNEEKSDTLDTTEKQNNVHNWTSSVPIIYENLLLIYNVKDYDSIKTTVHTFYVAS